MDDKQIAYRLVACGILRDCNNYAQGYYALPGEAAMNPFKGSNIWRVAGAVMEKMSSVHVYWDDIGWSCKATEKHVTGKDTGVGNVDALDRGYYEMPRAIIVAGLEALE